MKAHKFSTKNVAFRVGTQEDSKGRGEGRYDYRVALPGSPLDSSGAG